MHRLRTLLLLLAALLVLQPAPADAAEGRVVAVQQNATVTTPRGRERLIAGSAVLVGDVIETGPGGGAQLIFGDDTKIAVGPNARFEVVEALFNRGGSSRFTVTALRGSFRFISGRSPSSSYSIRTPTATIGIRGTAFDFAAGGGRGTDVLLLQGAVQLCGGSCAVVSEFGSVTNLGRSGQPEAVPPGPLLDSLMQSRFHFQANPEQLQPAFRVARLSAVPGFASSDIAESRGLTGPGPDGVPPGPQTPNFQAPDFQAPAPETPDPQDGPGPGSSNSNSGLGDGSNPGQGSQNNSAGGNPGGDGTGNSGQGGAQDSSGPGNGNGNSGPGQGEGGGQGRGGR